MPSFFDSIFLFVLALLLFGPKRLPVLARELGKWVGEFRRASNEFKMQMEDELRISEQEERQKKIAAMEAAAPVRPELPSEVVEAARADMAAADAEGGGNTGAAEGPVAETGAETGGYGAAVHEAADGTREKPLPIATSGEMKIMPPATGLPIAQSGPRKSALQELLNAVPHESPVENTAERAADAGAAVEVTAHGD